MLLNILNHSSPDDSRSGRGLQNLDVAVAVALQDIAVPAPSAASPLPVSFGGRTGGLEFEGASAGLLPSTNT